MTKNRVLNDKQTIVWTKTIDSPPMGRSILLFEGLQRKIEENGMFKIGDFSKFSQVSVKTLRYYDEIGLLKPGRVDEFTGYRYYSADQLPRLNKIVGLKDLGLSLEEIGLILIDNLSIDKVMGLLQIKHKETLARLQEEEVRLKKVEEWLRKVEKEGTMPIYDVILKKIEAKKVASVRDVIPTYGDIGNLFNELCSYVGRQRVTFGGPPMAVYYDHEYREKEVDVEAAVPVNGTIPGTKRIAVRELPGVEQAACLIHNGPYENFSQAYKALMTWIETNGYQIVGPNREVYLQGPGQGDPSSYITEIQLPVKKA
jgi:effector-binding domain-containing protein